MAYIGQPPFQEFTSAPSKDSFTGDGSTTTFDLASEVAFAGENALEVFINNVRQEPGSGKAYTLGNDGSDANKRITFTAAPANGAAIYVINDKTNLTTIAPTGLDLNGVEFILDADADTTLTADTDDRIDWKIAGADHISFGTSSGDTVIKTMTDAKDILFQQYDGRTILDINDGGYVAIANGATGPGQLRLYEDTDLGTNYTAFQVGTQSGDVTYTLPTADGTDGYQLTTDGSGTLTWAAAKVALANDANNRVVTGTGSGLNGEANLTFDGSTLAVTGAATVSTTLGVTGAITGSNTIQGTTITATTGFTIGSAAITEAELEIIDGATVTTAELNLIDGNTSRGTDAVATGDGILINDAGTMKMTNVDTVSTYFASHSVGGGNIVTVGALNAGSITSGFTSIDVGAGAITTTGVITGGTIEATTDTATGDNAAMGYTSAEGLILTGQGSTSDVVIKNDADATVFSIATGTTTGAFAGTLTAVTGTFSGTVTALRGYGSTETDTSNTGSITLDFSADQNFVLTLTGNVTLANPSTEAVGQSGFIAFIQDGTGSRTITLGTDYETAAGAGLTLTSTASATDLVPYLVVAANRILLGAPQLAFS